ncbi:hypothetical protein VP01_270g1 [Puccinia sorghi]|uniref:Uncharacterized protein n=1 Tax=Puccinia sorghi TaxID=27349 RepID=A0A0L6V3J0_9BASI|nr:hypothetical protein VP01_270g1 [Puccinia sorghi]
MYNCWCRGVNHCGELQHTPRTCFLLDFLPQTAQLEILMLLLSSAFLLKMEINCIIQKKKIKREKNEKKKMYSQFGLKVVQITSMWLDEILGDTFKLSQYSLCFSSLGFISESTHTIHLFLSLSLSLVFLLTNLDLIKCILPEYPLCLFQRRPVITWITEVFSIPFLSLFFQPVYCNCLSGEILIFKHPYCLFPAASLHAPAHITCLDTSMVNFMSNEYSWHLSLVFNQKERKNTELAQPTTPELQVVLGLFVFESKENKKQQKPLLIIQGFGVFFFKKITEKLQKPISPGPINKHLMTAQYENKLRVNFLQELIIGSIYFFLINFRIFQMVNPIVCLDHPNLPTHHGLQMPHTHSKELDTKSQYQIAIFSTPFGSTHSTSHCKKNLLNCLQLTCRNSNKAFDCTVTVPKNLHMQTSVVWMAAWLENAEFQLHAVKPVLMGGIEMKKNVENIFSIIKRIYTRAHVNNGCFHGPCMQVLSLDLVIYLIFFVLVVGCAQVEADFGELVLDILCNSTPNILSPWLRFNHTCCDDVLTVVPRAVILPSHHKQLSVMVTRCQLQRLGTVTRGPFLALAWQVPSQRCSHRLGWKCIEFWLYQACIYELKRMVSVLEPDVTCHLVIIDWSWCFCPVFAFFELILPISIVTHVKKGVFPPKKKKKIHLLQLYLFVPHSAHTKLIADGAGCSSSTLFLTAKTSKKKESGVQTNGETKMLSWYIEHNFVCVCVAADVVEPRELLGVILALDFALLIIKSTIKDYRYIVLLDLVSTPLTNSLSDKPEIKLFFSNPNQCYRMAAKLIHYPTFSDTSPITPTHQGIYPGIDFESIKALKMGRHSGNSLNTHFQNFHSHQISKEKRNQTTKMKSLAKTETKVETQEESKLDEKNKKTPHACKQKALQEKLDQLPAVDMQHVPAKPPSKLNMFAYVDVLTHSLCIIHSELTTEASRDFLRQLQAVEHAIRSFLLSFQGEKNLTWLHPRGKHIGSESSQAKVPKQVKSLFNRYIHFFPFFARHRHHAKFHVKTYQVTCS